MSDSLTPTITASMMAKSLNSLDRVVDFVMRKLLPVHRYLRVKAGRLSLVPRSNDIYIVSYPRSGTTWLQMILHQLAGGQPEGFTHIAETVPFLERAFLNRRDVERSSTARRLFKTHFRLGEIYNPISKFVYVHRDGRDVAVSYYHMHCSHLGYKGTFEDFFKLYTSGRVKYGSWFAHTSEWLKMGTAANVLAISYEELTQDVEAAIRRIADFCGFEAGAADVTRIASTCSFSYMKEHEKRFDHIYEIVFEMNLTQGAFVRHGKAGAWTHVLSEEQKLAFEKALLK
jgi:LPS sulfotransferase NodH